VPYGQPLLTPQFPPLNRHKGIDADAVPGMQHHMTIMKTTADIFK